MTIASYFPANYREGRAAFIKAADKAGMDITTRVHPTAKGPRGRPLFMDVACAGDRAAKRALMLISGTHGVEGYFGSGVQTGLLRDGIAKRVPKGVKLIVLHALNPFGFAWDRRVNEDNADINRNFVDYRKLPANPAYDALAPWISPKEISEDAMKEANRKLSDYCEPARPFALQNRDQRGPIQSSRRRLFRRAARELVVFDAEGCHHRTSAWHHKTGGDRLSTPASAIAAPPR